MAEEREDRGAEETHHPFFFRKKTLEEEELSKVAREGSLEELSATLTGLWDEFRQMYRQTEGKKIGSMEHHLRAARDRQSPKVFVTPKRLKSLRSQSSRITKLDDDPDAYFEEKAVSKCYRNCCEELRRVAGQQSKAAREKVESWFKCLESLIDESPDEEPATTTAEIVQWPPDFYEIPRATDDETADLTMPGTWRGSCLAYAGAVCALYALALSFFFPPGDAGAACEEGGSLACFFERLGVDEKYASWLKFCNVSLD